MIKRILNYISTKLTNPQFHLLKTIYLNFKLLPLGQAIYFPILVYGRWKFRCLEGRVVFDIPMKTGILTLGKNRVGYVTAGCGTLTLQENSMIYCSGNVAIYQGASLCVFSKAKLKLGDSVTIGDNVKIICSKYISIGRGSGITWESQVMDYNSHFIEDMSTNKIKPISNMVILGEYNWIGNRTTIMPGTQLPNRIIVTSNSLLNKDYIALGLNSYSLIGGSPAKLIKSNVRRIYSRASERYLHSQFTDSDICDFDSLKLSEKEPDEQ